MTSGRVRPPPSMWVLVGMCALVAGLGSSLGSVLGFMATTLRADLGLSRGGVGVLVSVFFGTTGVAAFTAGTLADRIGATRSMSAQMVLLALGCLGAAAVGSYMALFVACAVGGFAYALGVVGTNLAIVSGVGVTDQARALSLRTVGVAVFSMPCSLLAPAVAERVGWRPILVAIAVAALASVPLVRRIMSDTPAAPAPEHAPTSRAEPAVARPPLPPGFFWFPVGAFFFVAGVQAQLSWVVPYLSESVGLDEGFAGLVVTVATGVGILGALVLLRRGEKDASTAPREGGRVVCERGRVHRADRTG